MQQHAALHKQLADQKGQNQLLADQLQRQPTAPSQTGVMAAAVLPTPQMPAADSAPALINLRQSLHLLAQQDDHVPVTWGHLTQAHLPWTDAILLVPKAEVARSKIEFDVEVGPNADHLVPPRVLALLRTQLDAVVHQWTEANAVQAALAINQADQCTWAHAIMDEAKRVQEKKRPAETTAEKAKATYDAGVKAEAAAAAIVVYPDGASQIPPGQPDPLSQLQPTQLDASQDTQVDASQAALAA